MIMNSSQPGSSNEVQRKSSQSANPTHEVGIQGKTHSISKTTGKSYYHSERKTKERAHLNCMNISVKEHINLPKPSDNVAWNALDDQLYEQLPTEIGGSPNDQVTNLENHVYKRLVDRFGMKPISSKKAIKKPKSSRQQRKLRRLKKDVKHQFKQALKKGDKHTAK
jgi:hypothetical protein